MCGYVVGKKRRRREEAEEEGKKVLSAKSQNPRQQRRMPQDPTSIYLPNRARRLWEGNGLGPSARRTSVWRAARGSAQSLGLLHTTYLLYSHCQRINHLSFFAIPRQYQRPRPFIYPSSHLDPSTRLNSAPTPTSRSRKSESTQEAHPCSATQTKQRWSQAKT